MWTPTPLTPTPPGRPAHSLAHAFTHSLTHAFTHSLTHALTHALTQWWRSGGVEAAAVPQLLLWYDQGRAVLRLPPSPQ